MLTYFGFLRPDLSPYGCRNRYFVLWLYCQIVSNPDTSQSTGKTSRTVLFPCPVCKCVMDIVLSIIFCVDIAKVPGCHLWWKMISQWRSQKLFQGSVSCELTSYLSDFYFYFDSMKWPYQKDVNQIPLNICLKLSKI